MTLLYRYRFLIIIIFIATFLRVWQIGNIPPSPDWDEAALGYNAYSILKTGRDEYGTFLPLTLRSFDDYKPPLYAYLIVPSVAVFGLNTMAVRLPSALAGILAVLGTYFLTLELLRTQKDKRKYDELIPYITALCLALSPWHIQFSRIAFEANIGLTLNIIGVYCFLRGLRQGKWLSMSACVFALSLYAYHSQRLFAPLLLVTLFITFWKEIRKNNKAFITAFIVGIITLLPLLTVLLNPSTLTRLKGTSALADQTGLLAKSVEKIIADEKAGYTLGKVFNNRRIVWFQTIFSGYISHYSLRWLFVNGDNARHHAPDMGLMYLWELPFFLWGLYQIFIRKGKLRTIIFIWFFIAPIAASPTTELPHGIRSLVFLPTLQLFTAFGIVSFISFLSKKPAYISLPTKILVLCIIVFNLMYYADMYYVQMNHEFSKFWQFGYKEAVAYADEHKNEYKKIVVSEKLEQPYMFFLYYLKYDPVKYLAQGGTKSGGFEALSRYDTYEFRLIDWNNENKDGNTLYIGRPSEIHGSVKKQINYLNGEAAILIAN